MSLLKVGPGAAPDWAVGVAGVVSTSASGTSGAIRKARLTNPTAASMHVLLCLGNLTLRTPAGQRGLLPRRRCKETVSADVCTASWTSSRVSFTLLRRYSWL